MSIKLLAVGRRVAKKAARRDQAQRWVGQGPLLSEDFVDVACGAPHLAPHLDREQGTATRLATQILAVPARDCSRCRSAVNAMPDQLGIPGVALADRDQLATGTVSSQADLDLLTRSNARALCRDAPVAQTCGVAPDRLLRLADQRVELGNLGDALLALLRGADQQAFILAAAEHEVTSVLLAYFDSRGESEQDGLLADFRGLLRLREKQKADRKKTRAANAKLDARNQQAVLAAQNAAFVEQVKQQIRDKVDIDPEVMQAAALLYVEQLEARNNPAAPPAAENKTTQKTKKSAKRPRRR